MAPYLHARSQSPSPRHPYVHPCTPATRFAEAHVRSPRYSARCSRSLVWAEQCTTARSGKLSSSSTPMIPASPCAAPAPPGAHRSTSASPLATAAAYSAHPTNPHPPQFAPGSAARIRSTVGSVRT